MIILKKIKTKFIRKLYLRKIRKHNKNKDFTIIAQNCIGGIIYSDLGMQFKSPTIGLFIEDENFVKLVENLEYYLSIDAKAICNEFIDPIDCSVVYPKIAIDDIEICCLHYKNSEEAVEAWNKRRKRVNLNNVYVIANSWNLHGNINYIKRLLNLKYKTVVFATKDCNYDGVLVLSGDIWTFDKRGIVRPNITDLKPNSYKRYFEDFFDYISWLNK